jgi:glycosyltransferase involved in cell wall biosynthesis
MDKNLLKLPGIDWRGEVPHAELPGALAGADAFVFPYLLNGLTRAIAPAKTYEALATGKPVITSPLPAMKELGEHVYVAERTGDFVKVLGSLDESETEGKVRARIELARRNSWEARFRALEERLWERL